MYAACPRCSQQNYKTATICGWCGFSFGPTTSVTPILDLYVIINQSGRFLKGRGNWVQNITEAKIYPKIGAARSRVTWLSNNSSNGQLKIMKLSVNTTQILDESDRIKKAKEKKEAREKNAMKNRLERERSALLAKEKDIREQLAKLDKDTK